MRKRIFPIALLVLLLGLSAVSGVAVRAIHRSERSEARLREIYDGAILSALRQMEDMELALNKALLSSQQGPEAQYLNQVSAGAAQVQRSLSLLPLSHAATQAAVKFANQAADYTSVLLKEASFTDRDAEQLNALITACADCASSLAQAREDLSSQALTGKQSFYPTGDTPAFDSAVAYPTLIYDGPFSDARADGPARALPDKNISQEEALTAARDFLGPERMTSVSPGADMGGPIPCWGVTLNAGDVTLQAAVTKQGGKVLWAFPDRGDFPALKSVEECRDSARQFLSSRGYEHMAPTYFQVYQGVAVISFAATQGDTLLYPDLIKVQCRMDTAQVVGIEARNYLQNHGPRGLMTPRLTQEEARQRVSERLKVDAVRLCLIPSSAGEKLCYEFQGQFSGHTYLCYINALDGGQEQLLKVVEGEAGLEAV